MGKIIHLDKLKEFFSSTPVFTSRDVKTAVGNGGYSRLMLHNLVKKGEIKRLIRGCYTKLDDPMVSVFCFRPSYLGLYTALSLHNLWEQETNVTIVTSKKARTGVRTVLGSNVNVYRTDNKYMFGYGMSDYEGLFLPVSDIEKTFLDFLYFGRELDEKVLERMKERMDVKKLKGYASKYSEDIVKEMSELLG